MRQGIGLLAVGLILTGGGTLSAQTTSKRVISLAAADRIASAAEAEAKKRGATVVIVVVDDGGYPILLRRLDDTQPLSFDGKVIGAIGVSGNTPQEDEDIAMAGAAVAEAALRSSSP